MADQARKPGSGKAPGAKSSSTRSSSTKASGARSGSGRPAGGKPGSGRPGTGKPAAGKAGGGKPGSGRPSAGGRASGPGTSAGRSSTGKPARTASAGAGRSSSGGSRSGGASSSSGSSRTGTGRPSSSRSSDTRSTDARAGAPRSARDGKPYGDRSARSGGAGSGKPYGDRPGRSDGGRADNSGSGRDGKPYGDRPARSGGPRAGASTSRDGRSGGAGSGRSYGDRPARAGAREGYRGREDRADSRTREDRADRPRDPHLTDDIVASDLDRGTLNELRTLPEPLADLIARHLVAAERALIEDDTDKALEHIAAAHRRAARVSAVREAAGVANYRAGNYSTALAELRAAKRMTGSSAYVPMMADCERGLGRPQKALDLLRTLDAKTLDPETRVEGLIVAAGARADLGNPDAAVVTLQVPELTRLRPGTPRARLQYAYAEFLLDAGRVNDAVEWMNRAAASDIDGATDAEERCDEFAGFALGTEE